MSPADIQKMAIITPFVLFEYLFDLMNAAETFQRLMDRLFRGLPFVFTYLDDHLIASWTLDERMEHLAQFFQVLQDNGLVINPAKCHFAASSVKFLGHMVDETRIKPIPVHVKAIQEFPPLSTVKQLQQFLGIINFYHTPLPKIAATLRPLTDLLHGTPKIFEWSAAAAEAFQAAKSALVAAVTTCTWGENLPGGRCLRFPCRRHPTAAREPCLAPSHVFFSKTYTHPSTVLNV
jgi:hypothetical protein